MSTYPPDNYPPEPAYPDPYGSSQAAASGRAVPAGICLFIVGLINLLLPGLLFLSGVNVARTSPDQAAELYARQVDMWRSILPPEVAAQVEQEQDQTPPEDRLRQSMLYSFGWSGVSGLASLLTMVGGWRMWSLRNYGLALTGAIAAAIPCVSCTACCGLGEGIGVWALVVLLNPDVRAAFR